MQCHYIHDPRWFVMFLCGTIYILGVEFTVARQGAQTGINIVANG